MADLVGDYASGPLPIRLLDSVPHHVAIISRHWTEGRGMYAQYSNLVSYFRTIGEEMNTCLYTEVVLVKKKFELF